MNINLINLIPSCRDYINANTDVINLVYYSHLTIFLASLVLGVFVYVSNRHALLNKLLFIITILFSIWSILDLITWKWGDNSQLTMYAWSLLGVTSVLISSFCVYLMIVFVQKKDLTSWEKSTLFIPTIPVILLTGTSYNLFGYSIVNCEAIEGDLFTTYYYAVGLVSFVFCIAYICRIYKKIANERKREVVLICAAISLFLFLFFSLGYLASLWGTYEILIYGQIGMFSLIGFLAYFIVKFKAFNIKLLGSQALVWVMVILIGSQFLFLESTISKILNSITFVAVSIAGLILTRSVKKVDTQRELLEKANNNQQSLLHFITHQVKGYLTKSRNIFDSMIVGDYGPLDPKVREMAKYGFDSDTRGVETVHSILRASDLKTGQTQLKKERTNISKMVAEIVENRQDTVHQKNIDLTFEIEPNIEVEVDVLQINEVFKNLITNAIIYTQKGTIHVILKREFEHIRFAVIDTGFGLSHEDKHGLFTEGGKGSDSLSINIDSTGYGLYIAKKIVHQHSGHIGAHSEGRNKGSEFFVTLPDLK